MSLAVLYSRAISGMDAPLVTVEVHLANGLPSFTIVGLPDTEVREAKDRVREDLTRNRAAELSRKRGAEIAATLASARDFKAAAKTLGLEAKETQLISRGSPIPDVGASADIDKVAFSLPVGGVSPPITTNDGTAIVKVTERDEATPEELKKDRETFRAELLNAGDARRLRRA